MKTALPLSAVVFLLALASTGFPGGSTRAGAPPPTQTITICKQTCPLDGTPFQFTWANGSGALPSFTLKGGQCVTKDITTQDHYNVFKEVVTGGWKLSNITCFYTTSVVKMLGANSNPAFQPGDDTVSLDVNEANVTCTFYNERACVKPPVAMVSWWPGDGNPADIVGGFGGTFYGSAGYAVGTVGPSFSFAGSNFVEVADNSAHIPGGAFSIDAWVRPHGNASGRMTVVSKYECGGICPAGSNSLYTLMLLNGVVKAIVRDSDATAPFTQGLTVTGPSIANGQWHHLAMVRELAPVNRLTVYVDGAPAASQGLNAGSDGLLKNDDSLSDPLTIGAKKRSGNIYQGSGVPNMEDFFVGLIDEVEYFNRALTSNEVALIYQAGVNGKCKN